MHSTFPTNENDSVFFGPDNYRLVSLVRDQSTRAGATATRERIVDIGAGSRAGGIIGVHNLSAGGPVEFFGGRIDCVPLNLTEERFYHLDICFCALPGGGVLYYPAPFDKASRAHRGLLGCS